MCVSCCVKYVYVIFVEPGICIVGVVDDKINQSNKWGNKKPWHVIKVRILLVLLESNSTVLTGFPIILILLRFQHTHTDECQSFVLYYLWQGGGVMIYVQGLPKMTHSRPRLLGCRDKCPVNRHFQPVKRANSPFPPGPGQDPSGRTVSGSPMPSRFHMRADALVESHQWSEPSKTNDPFIWVLTRWKRKKPRLLWTVYALCCVWFIPQLFPLSRWRRLLNHDESQHNETFLRKHFPSGKKWRLFGREINSSREEPETGWMTPRDAMCDGVRPPHHRVVITLFSISVSISVLKARPCPAPLSQQMICKSQRRRAQRDR